MGFAEAFLSYFIYLGIVGMDVVAVREVARDNTLLPAYLTNMIILKSGFAAAAYLIICGVAFLLVKTPEIYHLVLLYGLTLFPLAMSGEWFFQGLEKTKFVGLFRLVREALFATFIVSLVRGSHAQLYYIPLLRFAAMLAAAMYMFYMIHQLGFSFKAPLDFKLWKYLTRESAPIMASQILILVIYNFPVIYLGLVRSHQEVGYYNAVYKMILFFIGFASIFWYVIFPSLSRFTVESKEKLRDFQEKIARIIIMIAVPIGFIGSTLAAPIITFLYGEAYRESIGLFRLMIWIGPLVMLNGIYAQGLLSSNNQKGFMKTVAVQTAVSFLLNLLLIPRMGITGAAIAWLSAEGVGLFLYKFYYNRVIRLSVVRYLHKPCIAGLTAALALICLNHFVFNVLVAIFTGFVCYTVTLFAIGGIVINDVKFVIDNFHS